MTIPKKINKAKNIRIIRINSEKYLEKENFSNARIGKLFAGNFSVNPPIPKNMLAVVYKLNKANTEIKYTKKMLGLSSDNIWKAMAIKIGRVNIKAKRSLQNLLYHFVDKVLPPHCIHLPVFAKCVTLHFGQYEPSFSFSLSSSSSFFVR